MIDAADHRGDPRRTLDKQEAIRHLLHSAIRQIMNMEDPFAIHLITHSADKMLIDVARKRGIPLRVDWEIIIKDEFRPAFFQKHRAIYNYFKHADFDFADGLPIYDIATLNVMTLFMAIENYVAVFGERTQHMLLLQIFAMNLHPEVLSPSEPKIAELLKSMKIVESMTPAEFFKTFEEDVGALTGFPGECAKDVEDIIDFYHLSFRELRAGETKSRRLFRLPN